LRDWSQATHFGQSVLRGPDGHSRDIPGIRATAPGGKFADTKLPKASGRTGQKGVALAGRSFGAGKPLLTGHLQRTTEPAGDGTRYQRIGSSIAGSIGKCEGRECIALLSGVHAAATRVLSL
jgi:hypothetical protein